MIRKATNSDSRVLAEMAVQMWDDNTVNELETEFLKTLNDEQSAFFIKVVDEIPDITINTIEVTLTLYPKSGYPPLRLKLYMHMPTITRINAIKT